MGRQVDRNHRGNVASGAPAPDRTTPAATVVLLRDVDGGEITDHRWPLPADAFERHARGEMELSLPTWLTRYHVMRHGRADAVLEHFASREPRHYTTHPAQRADGVRVALWEGDASCEDWDADREGPRHRLVMPETGGFTFENDVAEY